MKRQISLREANQHLSRYVEAVERGDEVVITRRGKAVAKLVRIAEERRFTSEQQAAWKRTLKRMRRGYALGGKPFNRALSHAR